MDNEEEYINQIKKNIAKNRKQKKFGIFCLAFIVVAYMGFVIWGVNVLDRYSEAAEPDYIRTLVSFENPKMELPVLFGSYYKLAIGYSRLLVDIRFSAILMGVICAGLIAFISGIFFREKEIFVSMWERINALEKKIARLEKENDTSQQTHAVDRIANDAPGH